VKSDIFLQITDTGNPAENNLSDGYFLDGSNLTTVLEKTFLVL